MKIGVLTSSRADYGIYLPLLKQLKSDKRFKLRLIVFGSHLSKKHGYTIKQIEADGFKPFSVLETMPKGDSAKEISKAIGKTIGLFAGYWHKHQKDFDLVLCLGDRYEMFAAVTAGLSFGIRFGHFHGGESSLGAIDEGFRHSITAMSSLHFTATQKSYNRVVAIKGDDKHIHQVGALSLDNLKSIKLLSKNEFAKKFGVMPEEPLLVTFHPETVDYHRNGEYAKTLAKVLQHHNSQVFITLPNADTSSEIIRKTFLELEKKHKHIHCFQSLGTQGYFSAISFCTLILGNSSSGIIEAASFGKYVINVGERQKGREHGKNVIDCPIDANKLRVAVKKITSLKKPGKTNIYGDGFTASRVVKILTHHS